jgi:parvulin-like peptidyl-prolyl isomerase
MKAGESKIVADNGGFVVIAVREKHKVGLPPLEKIRPQLRRAVVDQKRQKAMDAWLESLKQTSKITIDKKMVDQAVEVE